MAKTIIGEIYGKSSDAKICNLYEDEQGRMFSGRQYCGATLKELMDYCSRNGYVYQFDMGDDPAIEDGGDDFGWLYDEADYCATLDEQVKALFL